MHKSEKALLTKLRKSRWRVYRNGWPDFLCVRGDRTVVIESKDSGHLSIDQRRTLQWFASNGVKAFVVYPQAVFEVKADGTQKPANSGQFGIDPSILQRARELRRTAENIQIKEIQEFVNAARKRRKTFASIARELGVSRQRAHQIYHKSPLFDPTSRDFDK